MKKHIICSILAGLMLVSLVGCNTDTPTGGNETETTTGEVTATTEATQTETDLPATEGTTAPETTVGTNIGNIVTTETEATETSAPETTVTEATTTTAATTAPAPQSDKYVDILNKSVTSGLLEYCKPFTKADVESGEIPEFFMEVLGFKVDQTEDFAVSMSAMNVQAYCVGIVKAKSGQEDAVLDALNAYVERTQKSFENYLPGPYEVSLAAKVEKLKDGTVVIVMCEESDTVLEAIKKALK